MTGVNDVSKIDYNKRAVTLAKELLGKIIVHNDKKYMITVTEAYPFDEENNGEIKKISYVNKYRSGKGHDALIGEDKIGTCFVFARMLHIACKGGISKNGGTEYKCDNVLIRGAINVDDSNKFNVEDEYLNYMIGKPYVLCSKLELLPNQ